MVHDPYYCEYVVDKTVELADSMGGLASCRAGYNSDMVVHKPGNVQDRQLYNNQVRQTSNQIQIYKDVNRQL